MAAIRERGGKHHVQVRMTGFPARTASFTTRRQAERWAKTVEAEMIEGRHFRNVEARRRSLADAIDRYVAEELPKKRDIASRRAHLQWWREKIGHLRLADITPAVIVEQRTKIAREPYTRAKPLSKRSLHHGKAAPEFLRGTSTVKLFLAHLSHVLAIARREWHWISHNPFDGVSKPPPGSGRVRFLSDEERERLLVETANDSQLHTLVVLALSTAARVGELVGLTWADTDLKDGRLLFRRTKNSHPRAVWLHGEALRLLKEHGRVRRIGDDRVFSSVKGKRYDYRESFEAACRAAHVRNFRFHDLRHSAATYLARMGATEQQLRAIGGWKSGVVSRYVHLAAEDAREVLQKMNEKIFG